MSEIERLTLAVERLILATDSLTSQLRNLSSASAAPSSSSVPVLDHPRPVPCVVEIEELSRVPFPDRFVLESARVAHWGLETGPPELPSFLFERARETLSNKPPGVDSRVTSAYRAGHWARVAIATCTPYESRKLPKGHRAVHWVVLRSSFENQFRTTNRKDVDFICNSQDPDLVIEPFASLFEAETFCLAACCSLPALRSCSSQN